MKKFPESVCRMCISEPRLAGPDAWVHADQEENEVIRDGVLKVTLFLGERGCLLVVASAGERFGRGYFVLWRW